MFDITKYIISLCVYTWEKKLCKTFSNTNESEIFSVIYYHDIENQNLQQFSKQIGYLSKNYTVIPVSDLRLVQKRKKLCITFDDGFESFYETVLPVIESQQIPVTVFVPAGKIGCRADWMNTDLRVMDRQTIKLVAKSKYVTVGSHCLTHEALTSKTIRESHRELLRSKEILENIISDNVDYISFPHGRYLPVHLELAKKVGYKRVFGVGCNIVDLNRNDYFLDRFPVNPTDSLKKLKLIVNGSYRWLPFAFKLKRNIYRKLMTKGYNRHGKLY